MASSLDAATAVSTTSVSGDGDASDTLATKISRLELENHDSGGFGAAGKDAQHAAPDLPIADPAESTFATASGGASRPSGPPHYGAGVAAVIHALREQPPYRSGGGGLVCTDTGTYAECRARLILLALQLFPLLNTVRKRAGIPLVLDFIHESDPQKDAAIGDGTYTRPTGEHRWELFVRCRNSAHTNQLQEPDVIRNAALRALGAALGPACAALGLAPLGSEEDLRREFDGYKAEFKVPLQLGHLVWMRVLPERWAADYRRAVGLREADGSSGAIGGASASASAAPAGGAGATGAGVAPAAAPPAAVRGSDREAALKGSAASLWWPLRHEAITWREARAALEQRRAEAEESKKAAEVDVAARRAALFRGK